MADQVIRCRKRAAAEVLAEVGLLQAATAVMAEVEAAAAVITKMIAIQVPVAVVVAMVAHMAAAVEVLEGRIAIIRGAQVVMVVHMAAVAEAAEQKAPPRRAAMADPVEPLAVMVGMVAIIIAGHPQQEAQMQQMAKIR